MPLSEFGIGIDEFEVSHQQVREILNVRQTKYWLQ
jgi:hypothetical protein